MDKADVLAIARSLRGKPFRFQGRNEQGFDCVGLLVYIAELAGTPFKDHTDYPIPPAPGQLEAELRKNMISSGSGMHPGGAVLLQYRLPYPSHCAIFTGRSIIHSLEGRGVCETYFKDRRPFRFVEGFVFKGVTY